MASYRPSDEEMQVENPNKPQDEDMQLDDPNKDQSNLEAIKDAVREIHQASFRDGHVDLYEKFKNDKTRYIFKGSENQLIELIREVINEDEDVKKLTNETYDFLHQWKQSLKEEEEDRKERLKLIEELEKELDLLKIEYEAAYQKLQSGQDKSIGTSDKQRPSTSSSSSAAANNNTIETEEKEKGENNEDDDIKIIGVVKAKPMIPEFKEGMNCYANKQGDLWKRAVIISILSPSHGEKIAMYKVRMSGQLRLVKKTQIACDTPPQRSLRLGTRIIALYRDQDMNVDFYSGMVAEPPYKNNQYRYLVFFDDGCAQYTNPADIRVIGHQFETPYEGLQADLQDFIKHYINTYNERRILKMAVGQSVRCEREGNWFRARCVQVDCSLVKVVFDTLNKSEWIYRGSTRFEPLYALQTKLSSDDSKARLARNTNTGSKNSQYVNRKAQVAIKSTSAQSFKSKKTLTYRAPNSQTLAQKITHHKQPAQLSGTQTRSEHAGNRVKVPYPTPELRSRYVPHECGPSCIKSNDDPASYRGKYSMTIPIHVGFERYITRAKRNSTHYTNSKKFVAYKGPCGRRLRNMKEMGEYLFITDSKLTIDLFSFEQSLHLFEPFVATNEIVKKDDMSNGVEAVPISCVNALTDQFPDKLEYSNVRMPQKDVNLNTNTDFMVCCDCTDNCQDKSKCACQQLTYEGQRFLQSNLPLEKSGYTYRRLEENVITGVYECNTKCSCRSTCFNRVVQNPLSHRLQIFKTEKRGWGLRCLDDVPSGGFICIYAGQLLSEEGADQGGREYGDEYFAELDFIETCENVKEGYEEEVEGEGSSDEGAKDKCSHQYVGPNRRSSARNRSDSEWEGTSSGSETNEICLSQKQLRPKSKVLNKSIGGSKVTPEKNSSQTEQKGKSIRSFFDEDLPYVMDAKTSGNLGRYLNHSCDPNVFVQNVFVDTHDPRFPWIGFFANAFIRAGSELTWDYGYQPGIVEGKTMFCYCGSSVCRGRLL